MQKLRLSRLSKVQKVIAASAAALVTVVVIMLSIIHFYPGVAANTADSVLRPVIGDQATVAIESFMFSISDFFKQALYLFGAKPSSDIFTNTASATPQAPPAPTVYSLNLQPIAFHPGAYARLPGEGRWSSIQLAEFNGNSDMAKTFVLPDPTRAYAVTSLVKINMHDMHLHAVAGSTQPGTPIGNPGPGVIPVTDQASGKLVAAFNGGFQYKDGKYGMIVGQKTYVPLQAGLGTLIVGSDNSVSITAYSGQPQDVKGASVVRQNGPIIMENGAVTDATIGGGMARWGLTVTNSMYTWRSGVGVTKNGNLLYAVGPSLSTNTLAKALQAGGAVNAIQLDINPYWVRFVMFQPKNGSYTYQSLLKDMQNGGKEYLNGYGKDFFYLTMAK